MGCSEEHAARFDETWLGRLLTLLQIADEILVEWWEGPGALVQDLDSEELVAGPPKEELPRLVLDPLCDHLLYQQIRP